MSATDLRILGVNASPRAARRRHDLGELRACVDLAALDAFLDEPSTAQLNALDDQLQATVAPTPGSFDQALGDYRVARVAGASNTEVALLSSLWGAAQRGADIDWISLSTYFGVSRPLRPIEELRERCAAADGIVLATPVYFGDRSSLATSFIHAIHRRLGPDTVVGGIAVGAKRNGGQETALAFQIADLLAAGLLVVGNDAATTCQYGGTGVAGDVGAMQGDRYGLDTSIGTGRRVADVAQGLRATRRTQATTVFLVVSDHAGEARACVERLTAQRGLEAGESQVLLLDEHHLHRCLGCDRCPRAFTGTEGYGCIIDSPRDGFDSLHEPLVNADVIVPVAHTDGDLNAYQRFIERSRYLRRHDYALGNRVVAPLIVGRGDAGLLALRLEVAFLRHGTVLAPPLTWRSASDGAEAVSRLEQLAGAASRVAGDCGGEARYNPVGYLAGAGQHLDTSARTLSEALARSRRREAEEA